MCIRDSPNPAPSRLGQLLRQIGSTAVTLFVTFVGLLMVTFFISNIIPVDPVLSILGERASEAQMEEARERLGLNEPLWKQYGIYVNNTPVSYTHLNPGPVSGLAGKLNGTPWPKLFGPLPTGPNERNPSA